MRIETIAARELDTYIDMPGVVIVDVRPGEEYMASHIRTALSIPEEELTGTFPDLPVQFLYILYCDRGMTSFEAAKEFAQRGYRVKTVIGGIVSYRGKNLVNSQKKL